MTLRTSQTDPLQIAELPWPGSDGVLGVTFCPGKHDPHARTGAWARDLDLDLDRVQAWRAGTVVTLLEDHELPLLHVPHLGEGLARRGMVWLRAPIRDAGVPDERFEGVWRSHGTRLRTQLAEGGRVLVHCRGGLGRAGLFAARLLVEEGVAADDAIRQVRAVRPGAIETAEQEAHVRACTPQPRPLTLRERARGCLLGGAVGDALGAPVEFLSRADILDRYGPAGVTGLHPAYGRLGAITDDTQMTLWTAEGLIRTWVRGSLRGLATFEGCVGHAYLRWLRTQGERPRPEVQIGEDGWLWGVRALWSRRAPGNTCLGALGTVRSFGDFPRNTSKGCGGVMRAAPAGFVRPYGDPFTVGCNVARLTHGHPTGYLTAGFLAELIAALRDGSDLAQAIAQAQQALSGADDRAETVRAVDQALALAAAGRRDVVPAELGEGWIAEEALAIALWCALVGRDFADALCLSVNHGGDSDSTGSLTGQILGALHGPAVIPQAWLEPLELRAETLRLADDLAAAFGGTADPEALAAAGYPGW